MRANLWSSLRVLARAAVCLATALPLGAQGLFKDDRPVTLTVTTDLKTFLRVRDSTELVAYPATIAWEDGTRRGTVQARMRARGHWRRQTRNCTFPPVRFTMEKSAAEGSLFQGNRKVELTTACRPDVPLYQQYVLREYAIYRAYAVLTPWSHRTRLARITWVDSAARVAPITSWAFLIEDDGEVAERRKAEPITSKGATFEDLEPMTLGTVSLWEWLVGNTDWSVAALHNVRLMRGADASNYPVIYDFDFSGIVDTRYATPDPKFRISTVRVRYFMGDCRKAEGWAPVVAHFNERRELVEAALRDVPELDPKWVKDALKYLGEGWTLLADPKKVAREAERTCDRYN